MKFISVFNYGVIEMAKNHILSLRKCGIYNHCSYVTDKESAEELSSLGYEVVYISNVETNKNAFNFGTNDFNNLSYLRYHIIKKLLENGIDVWYLDVDIVVLRDLMPIYLTIKNEQNKNKYDVCFQNDINMPCTGCMLLFAGTSASNFVNIVIQNKDESTNDQIIVNSILKMNPKLINYFRFSFYTFPNGVLFFGSDFVNVPEYLKGIKEEYEKTEKDTYLVHANWMVGDETKKNAMKKYGLWIES